ncbi:DUF6010 family protein [Pedobacter immunditicola]|uniref:DUF6010 family protein n=1 Tax=Pedobacter immunditicola TaxID=3133440 RepID=UPI0030ABCAB7
MLAVLIGIITGIIIIFSIGIFKQLHKLAVYSLVLAGIGFLYPGFTWSDSQAFLINSIQAVFFLLLAYYGIQKGLHILAIGYFLHGIWDLLYHLFADSSIIPPQYAQFCSSLDFIIGFYLLYLRYFKF